MLSVLTIIHVLAAAAIIGLVLMQHGRGADAGAAFGGGGSAGSVFGARGPASFLTRATAILATVFFLTSLSLGYMSGQRIERNSVTDRVEDAVPTLPSGPTDVPMSTTSDVPSGTMSTDEVQGPSRDVPGAPAQASDAESSDAEKEKTQ